MVIGVRSVFRPCANVLITIYTFFRCVEYFLQGEPNICLQALYDKTLEQWLLNDLGDISLGCLPDSVCNDTGIQILNEHYPLQMQYVLDIGKFICHLLGLGILIYISYLHSRVRLHTTTSIYKPNHRRNGRGTPRFHNL